MRVPINRMTGRRLAVYVAPTAYRMQRLPESAPQAQPKQQSPNDDL